jgi:hypothetical protein
MIGRRKAIERISEQETAISRYKNSFKLEFLRSFVAIIIAYVDYFKAPKRLLRQFY